MVRVSEKVDYVRSDWTEGLTPNDLRVAPVTPVVVAPKVCAGSLPRPQLLPSDAAPQPAGHATAGRYRARLAHQAGHRERYLPDPAREIADRMLALRYDWMSDDKA